ncbi:MAG TPA: exosortase/archaeosortase family protein [Deltaproteobacteria bacterium]|nr:exosortase/archaeosortase family protein [Deltaproteobacteria bacterium]
MIFRNLSFLLFMGVMAVHIWVRDTSWMTSPENTLPIIIALPLFVWLGSPWKLRSTPLPLPPGGLITGASGYILGLLLDITLLLAAGWVCLLWAWISSRMEQDTLPRIRRLMVLPVLAFPWLSTEGDAVGWYFRITGAWATAEIFSSMGFNVLHEGTRIIVQGLPVGVGEACSGMNVLQSMLIAGSALAFLFIGRYRSYWWNIPVLVIIAWLANTSRIIILCAAALTLGSEFALGIFHTWGGWIVLVLMLFLSWTVFSAQESYLRKTATPSSA